MPWVKQEDCNGCELCVKACPVEGAIVMKNGKAHINEAICTRCGLCIDACPQNAIRPNSENPLKRGRGMEPGRGRGGGKGRGMGRGKKGGF